MKRWESVVKINDNLKLVELGQLLYGYGEKEIARNAVVEIISTAHKIRHLCISLATNTWVSEQRVIRFCFSFILLLLSSLNPEDFVEWLEVVLS